MENQFFCYCDKTGIGMGSDEHFGLFVDSSMSKGSTFPCKTYGNSVLSDSNHFGIKDIEVSELFLTSIDFWISWSLLLIILRKNYWDIDDLI